MDNNFKVIDNFHERICPWIIGNNFAKSVIALQLFSNPVAGEKFHLLLVGDIAAGKSDILRFVSECIPQSAVTDKKITPTGMFQRLGSCNGGLLINDEFDKIDKNCREMLLECMQSQTITEDKNDVHYTKKCYVNILAAANPTGHVVTDDPLYLQVKFSLATLTRFHMLIPFRQIDPSLYGDLAVIHNQLKQPALIEKAVLEIRNYIHDVRQQVPKVTIDDDLNRMIGNYIQDLKEFSALAKIISPRTIEGFTSFIKARARMMLRDKPTKEDFDYVCELFQEVYK